MIMTTCEQIWLINQQRLWRRIAAELELDGLGSDMHVEANGVVVGTGV